MMSVELCPCGTNKPFADCCGPLLQGTCSAKSAEELMRSRYTAYVKAAVDYLYQTTHPDHRKEYDHEGTRQWAESSTWLGLEIVSSRGGEADSRGQVEFIARYREGETEHRHHELGTFRKLGEQWYFVDGKMVGNRPLVSTKVGRNDPCPCGSGSKYKKCCGA
jgi:SEC-C motif-containing protein